MLSVYTLGYFRPKYIRRSNVSVPSGSGRYRVVSEPRLSHPRYNAWVVVIQSNCKYKVIYSLLIILSLILGIPSILFHFQFLSFLYQLKIWINWWGSSKTDVVRYHCVLVFFEPGLILDGPSASHSILVLMDTSREISSKWSSHHLYNQTDRIITRGTSVWNSIQDSGLLPDGVMETAFETRFDYCDSWSCSQSHQLLEVFIDLVDYGPR